jgi:hypothetical protein
MIRKKTLRTLSLGYALVLAWACTPIQARGGGLTAIACFDQGNGAIPESGVTLDPNGNLYGAALAGGRTSTAQYGSFSRTPFPSCRRWSSV